MARARRVILTRPSSDSQAWVQGLTQAGYPVLNWPLIVIADWPSTPAPEVTPMDWSHCQAVMCVSRHAVEHGARSAWWPPPTYTGRFWATGPGTVKALRDAGVPRAQIDAPPDDAIQFDTEALWQVVQAGLHPTHSVLFLRGTDALAPDADASGVGRDWLMRQLQARGVPFLARAVYQRQCPHWDSAQQALAQEATRDGSVWVFSSAQSLAHLARLLPAHDWSQARAVATHPRIAQAAKALGITALQVSQPTLKAIEGSLESFE